MAFHVPDEVPQQPHSKRSDQDSGLRLESPFASVQDRAGDDPWRFGAGHAVENDADAVLLRQSGRQQILPVELILSL
ncbi:hypothetical protein X743_18030 [Mesorhizobium sp. LNHC252B00]|nr:hypothetical protein X743_18030 [Mesorhizobium sp. LNHC252B00]